MNSDTLISRPHPKSSSSSSKWLHRLRSSRGFPDSDHTDLDHFLTTISSNPQIPTPTPHHTQKHVDTEPVNDHDSINNMLSELFHMGDFQHTSRVYTKKTSRKQPSPRICVVSANSNATQKVSLNSRKEVAIVEEDDEEEEEKCDWDVSGYSQTEVTVIDTSVASWKFEKVLYRRKNVWKVGSKKRKGLMSGDRKKRSVSENDHLQKKKKKLKLCSSVFKSRHVEQSGEKKKKKKKKKLKLCNPLKYVDKDDVIRSKSTQGHNQGMAMAAAYEKKQNNCSQVQEKSFLKKQIDGRSSVILIKSIPTTNKKDESGISKSCVKSMQK